MSRANARKGGKATKAKASGHDTDEAGSPADPGVSERSGGTVTPRADSHSDDALLAELDCQFRTMFEATVDGIVVADSETRRFYTANLAFSHMLGYSPQEVRRLALPDIHLPDFVPSATLQFIKLLKRELLLARDIPVKRKDGSVFYADVNSYPVTLAGRACLMGFFHDVSDRKGAEERLRDTESHFRSIMEQSSEGIVLTDEEGSVVEWNRAQEEITGWSGGEVLRRPLWGVARELMSTEQAFVPPDDTVKSWTREVCRTGEISPSQRLQEHVFVRRDGTRRCLQILLYSIRTKKGFRIGSVCRDITEKKAVERALQESEEKYRTLVESAGETIAMVDRSGTFLFMNKTGASRLGGTPDEYIGKAMGDLFPRAIAERQAGSMRKVIDTGKGMNVVVLTEVQGQQRWYNTTIEPIRDAAGKVAAALIVGRDIHELQQARQELERYQERMCRTEQLASLGALSATVAHELTQPLTVSRLSLQDAMIELEAISGSAKVMESLRECLQGICDAAGRIERFRNFAKQSPKEASRGVRPQDVVARAVRLLEGKARERRMSLTIRGISALPTIHAYEKDMDQMCFALIENAIHAADGKKRRKLVISGRKADSEITLRFEDTCGGISPEHVDKIFQPFFTTKPQSESTGLGLCIVERIVAQANGTIRVENHPGEGVAFCVTLPVQRQA